MEYPLRRLAIVQHDETVVIFSACFLKYYMDMGIFPVKFVIFREGKAIANVVAEYGHCDRFVDSFEKEQTLEADVIIHDINAFLRLLINTGIRDGCFYNLPSHKEVLFPCGNVHEVLHEIRQVVLGGSVL